MQELLINIMGEYGELGVFFLIFIENIFPPIPSEVILTFAGFMTTKSELTIFNAVLFSTLGSVLGAIVLYLVGRIVNKDKIENWLDGKLGKILRFKRQDVEKAVSWFDKKGNLTVLFCRCIPVVRSLISIPAGMAKMRVLPFIILTFIGSTIWNMILVLLGHFAGNSWEKIAIYISKFSDIIIIIAIIIIIVLIIKHIKKSNG